MCESEREREGGVKGCERGSREREREREICKVSKQVLVVTDCFLISSVPAWNYTWKTSVLLKSRRAQPSIL